MSAPIGSDVSEFWNTLPGLLRHPRSDSREVFSVPGLARRITNVNLSVLLTR